MLKRDLEILNSLSDRDIVCFIYYKICEIPIRKIAHLRNISRGEVFNSIKKCEKMEGLYTLVDQLDDLFV